MKVTLEIPDRVVRQAKSLAAARGISLRQLVAEAVRDKLTAEANPAGRPWMKSFGKLRRLSKETERINGIIDEAFETIETDD